MIRIERAIRILARERDHYLLRLELCGSERHDPSGYLRIETTLPAERRDELLEILDRWKDEGEI